MKMAFVPSGDIDGAGAPVRPVTFGPQVLVIATPPRPPPRPPPPPPRPPRPPAPPAGAACAPAGGVATTSRVFFTGSTTTFSVPVGVVRTYQKRPSGSQLASTVPPTTSPFRCWREHLRRAVVVGGGDLTPGALRHDHGGAEQGEDEDAGGRANHEVLLDGQIVGREGAVGQAGRTLTVLTSHRAPEPHTVHSNWLFPLQSCCEIHGS